MPGEADQEFRMPRHFDQVSALFTEEMLAETVACGPHPERHLAAITTYLESGHDEIFVSQLGTDQEGFFSFWGRSCSPGWPDSPSAWPRLCGARS